jgi:hypothetical protein
MATFADVLSSFDDYPIHQTSQPIAATATADLNHYDRYFFNGYDREQAGPDSLYFAAAMGLYPNRHVADASFSVVVGGATQVSVHASRRAPEERREANEVGPIRVDVVEPLRTLRIVVDAASEGVRADLAFHARAAPLEEPHFFRRTGQRVMMDLTRLTQFGTWEGWVEVDGRRFDCSPADTWGSRDRSWGIRPIGERGPTGAPVGDPQFFWLWAPASFDGFATHFDVNEEADGRRWHESGFLVPDGEPATMVRDVAYDLAWTPGTRWMSSFGLDLVGWDGGAVRVDLEPLYNFQMLGLGYGHPEWGHGVWKGELAVGSERWTLPVADPVALHHLHVQTLCRATARIGSITHDGIGILESLVIGPHHPTGLTGLVDGSRS